MNVIFLMCRSNLCRFQPPINDQNLPEGREGANFTVVENRKYLFEGFTFFVFDQVQVCNGQFIYHKLLIILSLI